MPYKIPIGALDDKTESQYAQDLTTQLITKCPEVKVFNTASFAAGLVRAWSIFLSAIRYIGNRALAKMQQSYYAFLGIEIKEATYATSDVTFFLIEPLAEDYTVPNDTIIKTDRYNGIRYRTQEELIIPAGATQGTVEAKASIAGMEYRVLENTLTQLQTPLTNILKVENTAATGGSRAETQIEAVARARYIFNTYHRAITAQDYEGQSMQVSGVYRAKCYRNRYPYSPGITAVGYKTLIIYPDDMAGNDELIANVETYLSDIRDIGNALYVKNPTWIDIDIDLTLTMPNKPTDLTDTKTTLENSIKTLFKDWEWERAVRVHDIRNAVVSSDVVNVLVNTFDAYLENESIHTINDGALTLGEFAMPRLRTLTVQ